MRAEREYRVGVMKVEVEGREAATFRATVEAAAAQVEARLADVSALNLHLFEFPGPHLSPIEGSYDPFDFLHIGLTEKVERRIDFLLMVTEVDLSADLQSYVLALPSQLTNVGIVSTKRLAPEFWGESGEVAITAQRLAVLMLHTLGHLLNLPHSPDPTNLMHDFDTVEQLEPMHDFTAAQVALMQRYLPTEAREEVSHGHPWRFAARQITANWDSIARVIRRANPFRLALRLPTMITAALSLIIVLFFTAEIWDVASTLELGALALFSVISLAGATAVLYETFRLSPGRRRGRGLSESAVVTAFATMLSLLLTMLFLYALFFVLGFTSAVTFFPAKLKETWPTVDPAVRIIEHVKLGMFLAAMGVLAGSLGGSADSQKLIRYVLFLDEES